MERDYQANQIIHGFRIISVQEDSELNGRIVRMVHERTKADLFWLDNLAENMTFSISFRTLPSDSTGVFHILEHSVLCGSAQYPVREPFVELLKSSMNTFLNAMTFPDMTMFPVSSRNFRDLMNLTRVYLDAVFHPLVMTDRKRFCQEGWHIDRDENRNPEIKGVVYNEMKGAMSDTDTLIDRQIISQLFPDTSYGYNSGGDPERMTELTWELFKEQYRQTYHPSNAYIYLDGRISPDEMLEAIDLSFEGFGQREDRPVFAFQQPKPSEKTIEYEISDEETLQNHSHLTIARIAGSWQDRTENFARSIVCDVLTGSNESLLKRRALEKGLCQDLNLSVDDTGLQSWTAVHAENITEGKEQEIIRLIEETGRYIQENGLDRESVLASFNRLVFNLREDDEPQGISRCIRCMGTWLYGGDPAESLHTQDMTNELREMLGDGRLDAIAADMLLNHQAEVILHSLPSHTVGERKRKEEAERVQRITGAWSAAEKNENDRLIEDLEKWQNTREPAAAMKTLPILCRKDADIAPRWTDTEQYQTDGVQIMRHRIPCNGVVYIRIYFPLTGFPLDELTKTALFAGMLGRLPTRQHGPLNLEQEIRKTTGSFGFAVMARSKKNEASSCIPYLIAFASALEENADYACRLLSEVLTETILEGQNERIRDMMIQNEISARQRTAGAGHLIAVKSTLSPFSAEAAIRNALDGEPAIRYIHRFASKPDEEMDAFIQTGSHILNDAVRRPGMIISVTGNREINLKPLIESIPEKTGNPEPAEYHIDYPKKTGFRIPSQVGFSARGYRLNLCGAAFSGKIWLTAGILSLEYLWNVIRVQGGSYGAGFQADRNGNVFSYSFRDPTPQKSIQADDGAAAFLRKFARNKKQVEKYIISSLNELNPLLSPREESALADSRIMTGMTREETEKIRMEILNIRASDLAEGIEWLDCYAKEGNVCIAGPGDMLDRLDGFEIREL